MGVVGSGGMPQQSTGEDHKLAWILLYYPRTNSCPVLHAECDHSELFSVIEWLFWLVPPPNCTVVLVDHATCILVVKGRQVWVDFVACLACLASLGCSEALSWGIEAVGYYTING